MKFRNNIKDENRTSKTDLIIFVVLTLVMALVLYLANMIWHYDNSMKWWNYILAPFGIWVCFFLFAYLLEDFMRSRRKIMYALFIIAFILFKLLPYIRGWKRF